MFNNVSVPMFRVATLLLSVEETLFTEEKKNKRKEV